MVTLLPPKPSCRFISCHGPNPQARQNMARVMTTDDDGGVDIIVYDVLLIMHLSVGEKAYLLSLYTQACIGGLFA